MKKYHRFSKLNLVFRQIPFSFGKLLLRHKKYFGLKNLTYYPELPHKNILRILLDQIKHIFTYGFPNDEYFIYGLDVKDSNCKPFVSELWNVDNLVYFQNNHPYGIRVPSCHDYSYNGCLRDKWIFALLMKEFALPTPETIGLIKGGLFTRPSETSQPLEGITKLNMDVMVKPIEDNGGRGIFHLKVNDGIMTVGGNTITMEQLAQRVSRGIYIVQSYINNQHEDMRKLYPDGINTLRITMVQDGNGDSILLGVMCMMGAHGAECSNWHFGGVCASVKRDGTISKYGYSMLDKRVEKHPDTGVVFDGYKIPYYEEAVELVKKCMRSFYGLKSVGWDVAITTEGPVIIEGNDDWGLAAHQMVENRGWGVEYFKYLNNE